MYVYVCVCVCAREREREREIEIEIERDRERERKVKRTKDIYLVELMIYYHYSFILFLPTSFDFKFSRMLLKNYYKHESKNKIIIIEKNFMHVHSRHLLRRRVTQGKYIRN